MMYYPRGAKKGKKRHMLNFPASVDRKRGGKKKEKPTFVMGGGLAPSYLKERNSETLPVGSSKKGIYDPMQKEGMTLFRRRAALLFSKKEGLALQEEEKKYDQPSLSGEGKNPDIYKGGKKTHACITPSYFQEKKGKKISSATSSRKRAQRDDIIYNTLQLVINQGKESVS